MKFDLDYILKTIANISALPVRLYKEEKMIKYYSIISFPVDPIKLYEKDILKSDKSIYIYNAPHFFFYGAIKYKAIKVSISITLHTSFFMERLNIKIMKLLLDLLVLILKRIT